MQTDKNFDKMIFLPAICSNRTKLAAKHSNSAAADLSVCNLYLYDMTPKYHAVKDFKSKIFALFRV